MKRKYEDEPNVAARENRDVAGVLIANQGGRPLMPGNELDTKIRSYLKVQEGGGGIVSQAIAIAEVTIQNNPDEYSCYRDLDLHNSYWAQSLFRRVGFRRHTATTGEVDVPPEIRGRGPRFSEHRTSGRGGGFYDFGRGRGV